MAKDIIADKSDKDSDTLWPPSSDKILDLVKAHIDDLLIFLVTKDYDRLADAILDEVGDLLSAANLDTEGEPVGNSGVYFAYPPASSITATSTLDFNYDWRVDPIETAENLSDFIDYVLDASGCSQVMIECHSYGGIIVNTYTRMHGSDKIKSVCYNTTAIYGEKYTGEMMSGEIVTSGPAIAGYLKELLGENEYSKLINGLLDIFSATGLVDDIADLGNGLVEQVGERAIRDVLLPMFGGWLSIWAMIPDGYVDSATAFVFDTLYKDDGIDHSALKSKIDRYNTEIRPYKTQTLVEQNEEVNLYVISRYGFTSVPLTPSWRDMSDTVVDTKSSSFGASCSDYNGSFSDKFIEEHKDDEYMNADATVYAATCLFPGQTWFIRDLQHAKSPDGLEEMTYELLCYDGQADTHTFEQYPRFLKYIPDDESVVADTTGTETEAETIIDKIFKFFLKLRAAFTQVIKKLKNLIKGVA